MYVAKFFRVILLGHRMYSGPVLMSSDSSSEYSLANDDILSSGWSTNGCGAGFNTSSGLRTRLPVVTTCAGLTSAAGAKGWDWGVSAGLVALTR